VALVTDLVGPVTVRAGEQSRSLHMFDRLSTGDVVATGVGARVVLAFLNGSRFEVGAGSEVMIEVESVHGNRGDVQILSPVQTAPEIAAIPALDNPAGRSCASRIRIVPRRSMKVESLYPRDYAAVPADAAVLGFAPLSQVTRYRVEVSNGRSETVLVVETDTPEVVIPEGLLQPGTEYRWQVLPLDPVERLRSTHSHPVERLRSTSHSDLPAGEAEAFFVTLSDSELTWLRETERRLRGEESVAAAALLAEIYQGLGMFREACAVIRELGERQPERPELRDADRLFLCRELVPATLPDSAAGLARPDRL
jgi:hypothetical protein